MLAIDYIGKLEKTTWRHYNNFCEAKGWVPSEQGYAKFLIEAAYAATRLAVLDKR
jgi:hypothetical protein